MLRQAILFAMRIRMWGELRSIWAISSGMTSLRRAASGEMSRAVRSSRGRDLARGELPHRGEGRTGVDQAVR